MTQTTGTARTVLLTLFVTIVGFSYALATSSHDKAGSGVSAREAGTAIPLSFANPFVSDGSLDRDLGDIVENTAVARVIRAKGGLAPYTFTAGSLTAFSQNSLLLLPDGLLTTAVPPVESGLPNPFRFAVSVEDSFGAAPRSKTENFRLTFVATSQFRFANDSLPDGLTFRDYKATLATINGSGTLKYSATGLENSGLTLAPDGTLFGRPLVAGTISFTATAQDSSTQFAAGRNGSGASQAFTINVASNTVLSSQVFATALTVKAGNGDGTDTVSYKGVANLGASTIEGLAGKMLSLRIGRYVAPSASFDTKGNATTNKGVVPAIKASIKKGGVLSIAVSGDFIGLANEFNSTVDHAVEVRIGDAVLGIETIRFQVMASKTGAVTLTYKGTLAEDLGGTAQVLSVQGADDRFATGDAWKVSFMARMPAALESSSISVVTVDIGSAFTNTLPVKNSQGKLSGKGTAGAAAVTSFSFDTKGKGSYITGVLPVAQSGISTATLNPSATFYSTGVTFKTLGSVIFGLENSMKIIGSKTKWSSQ